MQYCPENKINRQTMKTETVFTLEDKYVGMAQQRTDVRSGKY
jgi:hypothetical protein